MHLANAQQELLAQIGQILVDFWDWLAISMHDGISKLATPIVQGYFSRNLPKFHSYRLLRAQANVFI